MMITDKAKAFIEGHMNANGIHTLRFIYNGEGCCGPSYGVSIAEAEETDIVEEINGLKVAVDQRIVKVVNDITLDLEESPMGDSLVISAGGCC